MSKRDSGRSGYDDAEIAEVWRSYDLVGILRYSQDPGVEQEYLRGNHVPWEIEKPMVYRGRRASRERMDNASANMGAGKLRRFSFEPDIVLSGCQFAFASQNKRFEFWSGPREGTGLWMELYFDGTGILGRRLREA